MQYTGTYTGTIHEYCAEYNYTDTVTVKVDDSNNVSIYSKLEGLMQGGKIDSSGKVTGLSVGINSLSLGHIVLPYSGTDDGIHFNISGTAVNGTIGIIQANLVTPPVQTTDNGDGTHSVSGSGDDLVLHSVGYDVMTGGGVRDTFVFTPGFGQNEITDFVAGSQDHDTIDLSATRYHSLAQVLHHTTMGDDGRATIHLNPHDSITLDGVSKAQLARHPGDFAFA